MTWENVVKALIYGNGYLRITIPEWGEREKERKTLLWLSSSISQVWELTCQASGSENRNTV
jgi:hypothetical protein